MKGISRRRTVLLSAGVVFMMVSAALAVEVPPENIDHSGSSFPFMLLLLVLCFIGGVAFVIHLVIRMAKSGGKGLADFAATGWIGKEGIGMLRNRAERGRGASSLEPRSIPTDMKECPHCAELIKRKANICRFCNRDVS